MFLTRGLPFLPHLRVCLPTCMQGGQMKLCFKLHKQLCSDFVLCMYFSFLYFFVHLHLSSNSNRREVRLCLVRSSRGGCFVGLRPQNIAPTGPEAKCYSTHAYGPQYSLLPSHRENPTFVFFDSSAAVIGKRREGSRSKVFRSSRGGRRE